MRIANRVDPLTTQPDTGVGSVGLSPMDPPEAYSPPGFDPVTLTEMHPFLRQLCDDHAQMSDELRGVEATILSVQKTGFTKTVENRLIEFCVGLNRDFIPHSRLEEVTLFPLLHERLIADGEHSKGHVPTTSVDLMKDDHLKVVRLSAVIVNLLRLGPRLPDERSTLVLRDAALRHAASLVELLRLHMFREDSIVFSSAHRVLSAEELDRMQARQPERIAR